MGGLESGGFIMVKPGHIGVGSALAPTGAPAGQGKGKKNSIAPGVDGYTVAMLHLDGANGSQVFTDDTGLRTWAGNAGDEALSTTQKKFGTSSLYLPGNTTRLLKTNSSTSFDFGTGDFTIEVQAYPVDNGSHQTLFGRINTNNFQYFELRLQSDRSLFLDVLDYSQIANYTTPAASVPYGSWSHIALVRNGTNMYIFVNGISKTLTVGTAVGSSAFPALTVAMCLGNTKSGAAFPFNGYLDEFRVSKGIARWVANFPNPTQAYA